MAGVSSALFQLLFEIYFQILQRPWRILINAFTREPGIADPPNRENTTTEDDLDDPAYTSGVDSAESRATAARSRPLAQRKHKTTSGGQRVKTPPSRKNRDETQDEVAPSSTSRWPRPAIPSRGDGTNTSGSDTVIATPPSPTPQSKPDTPKKTRLKLAKRAEPSALGTGPSIIRVPRGTDPTSSINQTKRSLQKAFRAADKSRYKHQIIRKDQVRLLIIKPGEPTDEINATLRTIEDDELGGEDYPYEALSYHWGEGEESEPIIIQDSLEEPAIKSMSDAVLLLTAEGVRARRLYVKPNLHDALKHLRLREDHVQLWVDALCINQRNEEEKKHQVMKMAQIYRKSARVCVWLGPAEPVSYLALSFIKEIINPDKLDDLLNESKYLPSWDALLELLKWSWFSRRWVIQELALAKQATVHCGSQDVHWSDLKDAIGIFHKYFDHLKSRLNDPARTGKRVPELGPLGAKLLVSLSSNVFRRNRDGSYESTKELEWLVCQLAGFDTSDPRDTMIAMRNLAKELNHSRNSHSQDVDEDEEPPKPDYTLDLYEVYRDFLNWVFTRQSVYPLDMICRHWALPERAMKGPTTPRLIHMLPSWILTVDEGSYGRGEDVFKERKAGESFVGLPGKHTYHASPHEEPRFVFGTQHLTGQSKVDLQEVELMPGMTDSDIFYDVSLTISGLLIGVVDWSSDPIPDGVIPRRCLEKFGWKQPKLTESPSVPEQLWRTLVADRGPDGGEVPPYYQRACLSCLMKHSPNGHINTKELLKVNGFKDQESPAQEYLRRVQAVTWNRVCLEARPPTGATINTPHGKSDKLVGLGPPKTQQNDVIAIFYGCSVPVILRPRDPTLYEKECYEFIGEAYIYGKMDGEAGFDARIEQDFRLL
jgi:hypothetical protein